MYLGIEFESPVPVGYCRAELHDAVRLRVRQRLQQDGIDDREDRRVGADADGERGQRDRGEPRIPPHRAQRVAHIGEECFHWEVDETGVVLCSVKRNKPFAEMMRQRLTVPLLKRGADERDSIPLESSHRIRVSTMTSSHHASASTSAGILTGSLTDFRHAFRLLWKSKGITATTLVTLALCIGATTAIFSTVYSLMLKPLPYQEPERIVELYSSAAKAGLNHMPANVPFYLDYSKNGTSYESLGLWTFFYGLVGEKDSVVRIPGVRMTAEIFDILRIQPVIGTFFTKEQNRPGADKVIVLTQSYWQTQYGRARRSSARRCGSTMKPTRSSAWRRGCWKRSMRA